MTDSSDVAPQRAHLWNRDFILYALGTAASSLGGSFVVVTLPFLVLGLGGGAGELATAVLLGSLPRFLGPFIGALTDRLHLRIPLAISGLLRGLLFAVLAVLALTNSLSLVAIYAVAFLNGLLLIFKFSVGSIIIPQLVPTTQLARANGVVFAAAIGSALVGLSAAGVLAERVSAGLAIGIAAPCCALLAVAALAMRFPSVPNRDRSAPLHDLADGIRYLFSRNMLIFLLLISLASSAAYSLLGVIVPLTMQALGRGAEGYGLFESLVSAGTLLGILAVSSLMSRVHPTQQIGLAKLLVACGYAVLVMSGYRWLLGGALILGVGLGITGVATVTLFQLTVPNGLRGKVLGIIFSSNALGIIGGASLAAQLGERADLATTYAFAATFLLLLCFTWMAATLNDPDGFTRQRA